MVTKIAALQVLKGIAALRWRSAVALLWLPFSLLPSLVPPPAADPLPDCCQGHGAHKCFLWQAANASTVVTVPCNAAPEPKAAMSGANLTAVHPALLQHRILCVAPREALPHPVDRVPAAVFGVLSSRGPPHLV